MIGKFIIFWLVIGACMMLLGLAVTAMFAIVGVIKRLIRRNKMR